MKQRRIYKIELVRLIHLHVTIATVYADRILEYVKADRTNVGRQVSHEHGIHSFVFPNL